jgi:hypothetical protein
MYMSSLAAVLYVVPVPVPVPVLTVEFTASKLAICILYYPPPPLPRGLLFRTIYKSTALYKVHYISLRYIKLFMYFIQHCLICCPLNSPVPEDAGIEPRTVVTMAYAFICSNLSARPHPHQLDRIHIRLISSTIDCSVTLPCKKNWIICYIQLK